MSAYIDEMEWEAIIRKVNNGYILYLSADEIKQNVYVFEEGETNPFVPAIWQLAEHFAELGSKHDKERFWVGMIKQNDGEEG